MDKAADSISAMLNDSKNTLHVHSRNPVKKGEDEILFLPPLLPNPIREDNENIIPVRH